MLATTIVSAALATLSIASPLAPRTTSEKFRLQAHVVRGNTSFEGLWASPYHTGAAENAVTLEADESASPFGTINDTYQSFTLGGFPYTFDLVPKEPSIPSGANWTPTPPGYWFLGLNVGDHTDNFSLSPGIGELVHGGGSDTVHPFAACYVDGIAPYTTPGPSVQLLWRFATAGPPSPRCADIQLYAKDYNN